MYSERLNDVWTKNKHNLSQFEETIEYHYSAVTIISVRSRILWRSEQE